MTPVSERPVDGADGFSIRLALPSDLDGLRGIEVEAGKAFAEAGMASVAADEPPTVAELGVYQAAGRCWVVAHTAQAGAGVNDRNGAVVGYLIAEEVDGCCHIEQVSIHPEVAGHGLGRALIDHAGVWAAGQGMQALTLTTFVEVPWNGPYYERLGFHYLEPEAETPGLQAIRGVERANGLDRWPRACMRRDGDPVPPRRVAS